MHLLLPCIPPQVLAEAPPSHTASPSIRRLWAALGLGGVAPGTSFCLISESVVFAGGHCVPAMQDKETSKRKMMDKVASVWSDEAWGR